MQRKYQLVRKVDEKNDKEKSEKRDKEEKIDLKQTEADRIQRKGIEIRVTLYKSHI